MFKRLFWLTVGFGSGIGTSWYVVRSVKRTVRRTVAAHPAGEVAARAATRAGHGLKTFGADVRDAVVEGRAAMREREAELRVEVERRRTSAPREARAETPEPAEDVVVETAEVSVTADVTDELAQRRNRSRAGAVGRARAGR